MMWGALLLLAANWAGAEPSRSSRPDELVISALSFVGTPYRAGGDTPERGFDCSGLVHHVFKAAVGVELPRSAREMSQVGSQVSADELAPGDLVFYDTLQRPYSHVGIYLGEQRFVHAPTAGGAVRVEDMRSAYWIRRYNGARRLLGGAPPTRAEARPTVPATQEPTFYSPASP